MSIVIPKDIEIKLNDMAQRVMTQDNCGTASPIYHTVRRPVATYSRDPDGVGLCPKAVIYFDTEFYEIKDWIKDSEQPEDFWEDCCDTPFLDIDDEHFHMSQWDFQQKLEEDCPDAEIMYRWYEKQDYKACGTFLTRESAQHFIDCNRHHVGPEAFVYVRYAWRNSDAELLQELLESIYNQNKEEI